MSEYIGFAEPSANELFGKPKELTEKKRRTNNMVRVAMFGITIYMGYVFILKTLLNMVVMTCIACGLKAKKSVMM